MLLSNAFERAGRSGAPKQVGAAQLEARALARDFR
jgi:hypothetical protein